MLQATLQEIATTLRSGGSHETMSARRLLSLLNYRKRGSWINYQIESALNHAGLATEPEFRNAYIDEPLYFRLVKQSADQAQSSSSASASGSSSLSSAWPDDGCVAELLITPEIAAVVTGSVPDPAYRIGQLPSAHKEVKFVRPDDSLSAVITLMMLHDFSQIPVMSNEHTVSGMVTWSSIAKRMVFHSAPQRARECMETAQEVNIETSIFSVVEAVARSGYALVRDGHNKITGIVTNSDLGLQFKILGEPFLILGEIENYIRQLIDGRFDTEELAEVRDPSDERSISTVADLTLGEYVRLLQNPDRWEKLKLPIDRRVFMGHLDKVRMIRNDVMHFDPDGTEEAELEDLRATARYLRELHELGVLACRQDK